MNKSTMLVLMGLVFLALSCNEELEPITDTPLDNVLEYTDLDDEFLAAMFKHKTRYYKDQYTVIAQNTKIENFSINGLTTSFQEYECEIKNMIQALNDKNANSTKLTLKSSIDNGYKVDYDNKIENEFRQKGKRLKKWVKENPKIQGLTRISLPVIGKNGLTLIYYENFHSWSVGRIELYKFKNKKLTYLTSVVFWTGD